MAEQEQRTIKILLVDDDPGDRRLVNLALGKSPTTAFMVESSESLAQGLTLLKGQRFDLVLLDLGLPDSHGLGTIDKVLQAGHNLPIVVLTGLDDEEAGLEAIKKGASEYLVKGNLWNNMLVRTVLYALERKRATEKQNELQEQLLHVQKMDSIGMLAGGIAHDFNNLLQGIIGYIELMKLRMIQNNDDYPELNQIEVAAEKASELTKQLLSYARKGKYVVEPIEINTMVNQVVSLLNRTIDKNIAVCTEIPLDIPTVKADSTQMYQMLLNLCINAKDAMPNGGKISISTTVVNLDERSPILDPEAKSGEYLCLCVADTGTGMDKETQSRIFEPFFSTKEVGKGTGMGLSLVYGIVKNHDGFIQVESTPGQGSEFQIYLPVAKSKLDKDVTVSTSSEKTFDIELSDIDKKKRLLVIEDEDILRYLAMDMLTQLGYEPLPAEDGLQAIDIIEKEKDSIDLVLLDMIMPRLGGVETFRKLKTIAPDIPVVIVSGYSKNGNAQQLIDEGARGFIQKPYRIEELMEAIKLTG